jgi:hypothetical protein
LVGLRGRHGAQRRAWLSWPQDNLDQIGLALDQYCERESGMRRFGAERLLKIVRLLGVKPQHLFEVLPGSATRALFN